MAKGSNNTPKNNATPSHSIKREILGLIFLLVVVLLAGSLFSYHPSDKLWWSVTGPLGKARNLFGTTGAHLSGGIFFLIGFSSFWLVVICVAMAFLSFRGLPLPSPIMSLTATLVLIVSFSAILSLHFPKPMPFREGRILAGGLVGLHLAGWISAFLNRFGAYILLGTVFLISLMIVSRLSLGWLFSRIASWIWRTARRLGETLTKRRERKKRARRTRIVQQEMKTKRKVTIIKPPPQPERRPEQEAFAFMNVVGRFTLPSLDLLNDPPERQDAKIQRESLEANARRLEKKLADFGVDGEVQEILPGPVITMYEFKPAPGIKISKVAGLSDDLALALRAQSIRIVAPIPGKAAIGIEIPNNQREMVYLKEVLSSPNYREASDRLPMALGKDITGSPVVTDLTRMPHLLIAGATGTGKSVSLNTILNSILFKLSPDVARILLIDPKRIELSIYHDIPHLLHPVVTQPKEATRALKWAVEEMERRYMLLSDRGFRNIDTYNRRILKEHRAGGGDPSQGQDKVLPYIILIIDELADLMMASSREVEEAITRLAQMARAAGIHLIIATQRPSVDVLTGIIKANFPTRISFQVSSKVDSRTILDTIGAEHLLGNGDMLFMPPGVGRITRIHGAFVSEEEIKRVTDFLRDQRKPEYDASILTEVAEGEGADEGDMELDEKYDDAVDVVMQTGQASISMIQRKLRVGYNRAARMIEAMEREGIVGPSDGIRPREVYGRREA